MDSKDNEFHRSIKPHWGPRGTLVYAMPSSSGLIQARRGGSHQPERAIIKNKGALVSQGKDVRFASLNPGNLSIKMLNLQKGFSKVNLTGDVPYAKLHAVFDYEDFMNAVDGTEPHQIYEKHVWELVSCLFDDDYDKPKVNRDIADYFEIRFRKDRLSAFWVKLTQDQARQQVRKAKSKEEGAIYHLSAHQIEDACASLIDGRDYRLATLVAMIGGDEMMRQDMRYQIDEWRRMKLLSEMTEPIRAIYELLAGNTCVCDGFDGPFEDRAWTFVVSKSFGLGWKQAFGLRLWYGIKQEEPISAAVQKYLKDLDAHLEDHARPVPWFVEQRIPLMWDDKNLHRREDLFWGILKIYSDFTDKKQRYALEDILMPENHQLNPMDYQLTWQLYHAFSCARIADIRPEIDNPHEDSPKIDQLTLDFATQLEMAGHWTWALFVILHLLDTPSRALGIQRLLAEHGGDIGDGPDDEVVQLLIEDYRIAQPWIWEAKALHARSVTQDHVKETEYLLKARNWVQAHETMAQNVAPRAVIENETEMLQKLLDGFHDVKFIGRWNLGGQVYVDYLRFLQILEHGEEEEADTMMVDGDDGDSEQDSTSSSRREDRGLPPRNDYEAVLSRLLTALPAMMHHGDRKLGFYERVAVQEMSNVVAEALLDEEDEGLGTKAQLLSLPLTEDSTLKHTVQLSVEYYQAVMAGGK
ncbi:MAG: hypothetical protein M1816_006268 [Peltula sp. TS41687]|nr:MAG: hypothetical protein M1816_006268 [Peltula sp. TS41687]